MSIHRAPCTRWPRIFASMPASKPRLRRKRSSPSPAPDPAFAPSLVLERDGAHGVHAGLGRDGDEVNPLAWSEKELGHPARPRQRVAVSRHRIEPDSVDANLQEQLGADIADPPELRLSGRYRHDRFDLAVDRDDLVSFADLDVLQQEEPFRHVLDDREKPFRAVDDESARHAAEDLPVDDPVGVRVIPEETRPLATGRRDYGPHSSN